MIQSVVLVMPILLELHCRFVLTTRTMTGGDEIEAEGYSALGNFFCRIS